ncbi:hypothetical protein [Imperialibacter sp.]|uniref:hypothetical protein n=1 Tax=Imperialibacter sp. TaxID=2038411 RepID=UPI0032EA9EB8
MEISRIDLNGNVKWSFSGKDIFVSGDGTDAVNVRGGKIEVTDWQGTSYVLNEAGQILN